MNAEEAIARQKEVVASEPNLYVQACPGAGKTRTVVERYMRLAGEQTNTGIAVVSFTNRASDEVAARCAAVGRSELASYPNFIGTFDRFIATYIVRPFGKLGGPIRIVDSWASLDVQIAGAGGMPVSLDRFEISPDGVLRYEPRDADPVLYGNQLSQRLSAAAAARTSLLQQGYLTCDDARELALRLLKEEPSIVGLLRRRFSEVIVDEAQDCNATELSVLEQLREGQIPIVVVCDPHQAIYEWRDASPEAFADFTAPLATTSLDGNWRSTPAICALASTLKDGATDQPVGPHAENTEPIRLVRYAGAASPSIGSHFVEVLGHLGMQPADGLVLSHASTPAARSVGANFKQVSSRVGLMATAASRLSDARTDARERVQFYELLQRLVLSFLRINPAGHSTERLCDLAGIDQLWLRRSALALAIKVSAMPLNTPIDAWMVEARAALTQVGNDAGRQTASVGQFLPTPANSSGTTIGGLISAQAATVNLTHSTIHRAKGMEAPGVLVVLPPDRAPTNRTSTLLAAWEAGEDTEARRVIYVGVTRAERLCMLAVPTVLGDRVIELLHSRGVPFEVTTC